MPWEVQFGCIVSSLWVETISVDREVEVIERSSNDSRNHLNLIWYPGQEKFSKQVSLTSWNSRISRGS